MCVPKEKYICEKKNTQPQPKNRRQKKKKKKTLVSTLIIARFTVPPSFSMCYITLLLHLSQDGKNTHKTLGQRTFWVYSPTVTSFFFFLVHCFNTLNWVKEGILITLMLVTRHIYIYIFMKHWYRLRCKY